MEPERLQPQRQQPQEGQRSQMQRPEAQRPEPQRPEPEPQVRNLGERPPGRPSGPADSAGSDRSDSRKPSPDTVSKPPSFPGGMVVKGLVVAVLAGVGWLYFGRGPAVYSGPEELAPNYQKNKDADPRIPMGLSAKDLDNSMTARARDAAMRGEPIPGVTNPSPAFIDAVKKGKVTFYAVRAYDTCAEDGDVVTLRLPIGADIGPIPLTIAGTTVTIPVVDGEPRQLTVIGVKDGVGGITLGVQTSGGVWFSQVMPVGGTETMPLDIH